MRTGGRLIAFAKALQRTGNRAAAPEYSVAQRPQFHSLTRVEGGFSQPSHPLAVYRPWYPAACKIRAIHSSDVARQTALEESSENNEDDVENYLPRTTREQKPRLVVLGTGWAGCRLIKDIDPKLYDIVCISPRNHMVFTPLLASTCVGTLEFRSVVETVRTIQPAIAKEKDCYFFLAHCTKIDADTRRVHCKAVGKEETADMTSSGRFSVPYDKLVVAMGAQSTTFGIGGVHDHAIFLRDVRDAQAIRSKLLLNLAISDVPGVTEDEKRKILHCVVVGGGPTGVEFSGELSDFIRRDVIQKFSHVKDYIRVTLIEAAEILSSFDDGLRQYATSHLEKTNVKLVKGLVKEVHAEKVVLSDGTDVPYGLLVWSTGVGPSDFVKGLSCEKSPKGSIGVDDYLRVPAFKDVYAIGDCSGYLESTGKAVLPALAQVAERQGKYLAESLNLVAQQGGGHAGATEDNDYGKPFVYKHMGSMASVGRHKALVDLRENKKSKGFSMAGFSSWIVWRSAYLTRVISWRNRIYVALNWTTTIVFGREISRF